MKRSNCVFCKNSLNSKSRIYTQDNFPISFYGTKSIGHYEYINLEWHACEKCNIVQLGSLVELEKLYGVSHNHTFNTPTWKEHHSNFLDFIKLNSSSNKIIEIGGGSNILASKLNNYDYTVLDLYNPSERVENVKYINQNCETFDYSDYDCVIMSHVFEHLYNPIDVVNKLNSINEIFISVPNLKKCLETDNISFIHNEHTFYFEESDLIKLFRTHILNNKYYFKNHSIFFHFVLPSRSVKSEDVNKIVVENSESRVTKLIQYFKNREERLSNVVLKNKTFIVPSGHFGSMIYYYNKFKDNIIGFIDNDKEKQNKYLYGTNCLTYSFDILKNYTNIDVVLHAGPYSDEIINQIKEINNTVTIIRI